MDQVHLHPSTHLFDKNLSNALYVPTAPPYSPRRFPGTHALLLCSLPLSEPVLRKEADTSIHTEQLNMFSPRNINNLTGNRGKELNAGIPAPAMGVPEIPYHRLRLFSRLLPAGLTPRMPTLGPPCTHLHLHGQPTLSHQLQAYSWNLPPVARLPAVLGPQCLLPRPPPLCPPSGGQAEGMRREMRKAEVRAFPFPLFPYSLAYTPRQEPRSNGIFSLQLPLVM